MLGYDLSSENVKVILVMGHDEVEKTIFIQRCLNICIASGMPPSKYANKKVYLDWNIPFSSCELHKFEFMDKIYLIIDFYMKGVYNVISFGEERRWFMKLLRKFRCIDSIVFCIKGKTSKDFDEGISIDKSDLRSWNVIRSFNALSERTIVLLDGNKKYIDKIGLLFGMCNVLIDNKSCSAELVLLLERISNEKKSITIDDILLEEYKKREFVCNIL